MNLYFISWKSHKKYVQELLMLLWIWPFRILQKVYTVEAHTYDVLINIVSVGVEIR